MVGVALDGAGRVVADLQVGDQALAEVGHEQFSRKDWNVWHLTDALFFLQDDCARALAQVE
jgi:hypothetical protein